MQNSRTTIALADDHILMREAIASMLVHLGDYEVILQASNGLELIAGLEKGFVPDLVLLDISMPELNGIKTARVLTDRFPQVKIIALSMMDNEESVVGVIKNGARGYILKDSEPMQLKSAIESVMRHGYFYSDLVTGRMMHRLQKGTNGGDSDGLKLSVREMEFLKLACSELTYKEIADRMFVSPRTVDGYRDALFEKLGVKSRVGLCLYAVRMAL